jgi:Zn-dependent M28 family amino/carboxypeptidase
MASWCAGQLQRQVRFAFCGAEESGLLGSEHYVENLTQNQQSSAPI